MQQRTTVYTTALLAALFGAALVEFASGQFTPPAIAAIGTIKPANQPLSPPDKMADLLSGKLYPITLKPDEIDSTYHLVGLLDAQEKSAMYATRGDTVMVGDTSYLVAYYVPVASPDQKSPPQPKPGEEGHLTLLNLHDVQAMAGFIPIIPPAAPPADTGTPVPPK